MNITVRRPVGYITPAGPPAPIVEAFIGAFGKRLFLREEGFELVGVVQSAAGEQEPLDFYLPTGVNIAPRDIPRRIRRAVEEFGLNWHDARSNELGTPDERDSYADDSGNRGVHVRWRELVGMDGVAPTGFSGIAFDRDRKRIAVEDDFGLTVGYINLSGGDIDDELNRYAAGLPRKRKVQRAIDDARRQVAQRAAKLDAQSRMIGHG